MLYLLLSSGSVFQDYHFFKGEDKLAHWMLFFIWTFTLDYLLLLSGMTFKLWNAKLFVIGCVFAAMTEVIQHFIPHRTMDLSDFVADALGVTLALLLISILKKPLIRIGFKLDK